MTKLHKAPNDPKKTIYAIRQQWICLISVEFEEFFLKQSHHFNYWEQQQMNSTWNISRANFPRIFCVFIAPFIIPIVLTKEKKQTIFPFVSRNSMALPIAVNLTIQIEKRTKLKTVHFRSTFERKIQNIEIRTTKKKII